MASALDNIVFGKKKFSDLLNEIYSNQRNKEKQIYSLIQELKPLIKNTGDATLLVPLIKEYLEIGVKNDEHLLKLATVIQRIFSNNQSSGDDFIISEDEKKQLLDEINNLNSPSTLPEKNA